MPKYQFFCKPDSNRKEYTYIDMASETFLIEKKQLIDIGFEVEDDVIYAETTEEAVDKFKSNFLAPLEDMANSTAEGGAATFVYEMYKTVTGKKKQQ